MTGLTDDIGIVRLRFAVLFLMSLLAVPGAHLNAAQTASIVFGSFSTEEGAQFLQAKLVGSLPMPTGIVQAEVNGLVLYRVASTPSLELSVARARLQLLREEGFPDAWLSIPKGEPPPAAAVNVTSIRTEPVYLGTAAIDIGATEESGLTSGVDADLLGGFDDFDIIPSQNGAGALDPWFDVGGQLAFFGSYSYNLDTRKEPELEPYNGLSKAQLLIRLHSDFYLQQWRIHLEAKGFYDGFYALEGEDQFSSAVLDRHQSETEWQEVYVQGDIGPMDLKAGRQILPWGRSDNLRVLDLLNPLDWREPGSTDIEDIRLPVTMTRVRYAYRAWTLEAVAIHEVRFNKLPAPGSEFLSSRNIVLFEDIPADGLAAEHALSFTGVFPGWDISLHSALVYDDDAYIAELTPMGAVLGHARLRLTGLAFNRTLGSWLFKGEFADVQGVRHNLDDATSRRRTDMLLGVEFAGFTNTQVALETSIQHLRDWRQSDTLSPDSPRDVWQSAFRISRSFLNERLSFLLVGLFQGKRLDEGYIIRTTIDYKPRDALTTSLGLVLYSSADQPPLSEISDRDRIMLGLKVHF